MPNQTVTLRDGQQALIRPLTTSDTRLLYRCFRGYGEQARRNFAPHPFTREIAEDICSQADDQRTSQRFLIVRGAPPKEQPLGYAFLWFLDQEIPSLGIGMVDAAVGRGLGRCVLEFLLERARELGHRRLWLSVMERNARARALYESAGFAYYGEPRWSENGQGMILRMEKVIAPVEGGEPG